MNSIPPIITSDQPKLEPVAPGERIHVLDILRGFALLGILAVNMQLFSSPIYLVLTGLQHWEEPLDVAVERFIRFFAHGKFYPIFSFLFGLGMALQYERAERRGAEQFGTVYARRLFVLLGFGMVHAFLIWEGDILLVYAMFGFLLLLFVQRSKTTLLVWAGICLVLPILLTGALYLIFLLARMVPEAAAGIDAFGGHELYYREKAEENIQTFAHGTYLEILRQRLANLAFLYKISFFYVPIIFGMFLLGLFAAKQRLFHDVPGHRSFFWKTVLWAGAVGLIGNTLFYVSFEVQAEDPYSFWFVIGTAGMSLGATALALCYVSGITLLAQREWWLRRLAWLAPVGRMALTNYLAQSLICTTIFYSYGLGLFGAVGPAAGLLLTFGIFIAQIFWSRWWMSRFEFGPAERLWRRFTYGHW
jgi:uncharacterized protein